MAAILEMFRDREVRRFDPGQIIIQQGQQTDRLYYLIEGEVEILKDDVVVAITSHPSAVFGEMAILLGGQHTATVRARKPCAFYIIDKPREFLASSPAACLHMCDLLARRLDTLNRYLVDVKHQFDGHDHLGMVDEVLQALLHRHAPSRVRPKESTIDQDELAD